METKVLKKKYGQIFVVICILLVGWVMEAAAVTLPFSDSFDGDGGDPGSEWSWTDEDGRLGTVGELDEDTLRIKSRGDDVWTGDDDYAAFYLDDVSGDFTASVQIVYQQNSNDWAKCGIMVRNNIRYSGYSTGYVICALTPSHGYTFQWDSGTGDGNLDSNTDVASPDSSPNTWVRLTKTVDSDGGADFEASYSTDGSNWTSFATVYLSSAADTQDVGLFVCSHDGGVASEVNFDNFSIIDTTATVYTYYADTDGDGYGDNLNTTSSTSTTPPSGYVEDNTDCNDSSAAAHPDGTEVCDGLDNDCNGSIDEGVGTNTYYYDGDGDGYGTNTNTQAGCTVPDGYVETGGDCNDGNSDINPGVFDLCGDGIDQDCSGTDRTCGTGEICMDIADVPVSTLVKTAPPMIMFVLDDSGSMAWDVLCPENNGQFDGASWVYDRRTRWKSQFYDYNGLYYNPSTTYEPWPNYSDADPDDPRKHPVTDDSSNFDSSTRDLDSTFTTIGNVTINYAHWYMYSEIGYAPYLVLLNNNSIIYHKVTIKTDGDHGEVRWFEKNVSSPPADVLVTRTYAQERQNFANWYTYYRTRELTAKAALGKVINEVNNVKVGIYAINEGMKQTISSIGVDGETDIRDTVLDRLYHVRKTGWTPLRQGLQAVGEYYKTGIYADAADGGACQQAFTIVMTDGYYNGDEPTVGNADNDSSSSYDGGVYGDLYSNTLADVAMYYYETDLDSLDNSVSGKGEDTASHQHMVTYTVSFGLTGTLKPNDSCPETESTCPTWVNPENGDDEKIDDLWHTAVNGRGEFLSAADTEELIYALTDMIMNIQDRSRTGAAVSMNSQRLEEDTDMFQAYFDTSTWTGNVKAFSLDADGNVAETASWDAQYLLEHKPWDERRIFTYDGTSAVPFDYDSLNTVQKNLLSTDETTARNLVDYICGDRSNEVGNGGTFRNRSFILGDIVNSSPRYDNGVVYVGANDGMLHAFSAVPGASDGNGVEHFGFIPSRVIENLKLYSDVTYSHKFYVDGPISTAVIGNTRYLVGGLGKGGRGYYGMNITRAASVTDQLPDVWEYPAPDVTDNYLGFTYSAASILDTNIGRPLIIFGNGYDSPNGTAVLYFLELDGSFLTKIDTEVGDSSSLCNGLGTPVPVDLNYDGTVDYIYAGDLLGNMWKFDLSSSDRNEWGVYFKDGNVKQPLFQAKNEAGVIQPITGPPDVMYHCDRSRGGVMVVFGTGRFLAHDDISDNQVQSIYGIWDWSASWEALDETGTAMSLGTIQPPSNEVRMLSNLEASDFFADGKKPRLLKQEKYWDNDNNRFTTNHEINWFDPETYATLKDESKESTYSGGLHVGWYVDLPDERERVIAYTQIREGTAILTSIIPSDSPCESGGRSYIQFIKVCDGGAVDDTDQDGTTKTDDDPKNTICPPVTTLDNNSYLPGEDPTPIGSETQGVYYWKIFR